VTYSNLALTTHTFRVTISNPSGARESTTYMWTINGIAPKVTLTTVPGLYTPSTDATFAWSTVGTVTSTTCSLDGSAAVACSSPKLYTGLLKGFYHTFKVTVSNAYGSRTATYNWSIAA